MDKSNAVLPIIYVLAGALFSAYGCGGDLSEPHRERESQKEGADGTPMLPRLETLTLEERNAIWWEVEKSNSTVAETVQARWSEKGSLTDTEFVQRIDREVRTPIAERYGMTYEALKRLFNEGETASWRTEQPPVSAP